MTTWTPHHSNALGAVFDELNQSDIKWLVLRNHEGLPEINPAKDIDLAVAPRDFRRAEAIISATLRGHGFDRRQTAVFQWGRCSSYYGTVEGEPVSIKIDLMDGYSWRAAALFDAATLHRSSRSYATFRIPDPIDTATILWLKPLMTGGIVKQTYVPQIDAAIRAEPDRFRANVDRLFGKRLASIIWLHLAVGHYKDVLRLRRRLSWTAWIRSVRRAPFASAMSALVYIALEVRRRASRPRGTLLGVLGPDGVGKTTFIESLVSHLADLQTKDRDAIFVQHFRPRVLPNLKELVGGRSDSLQEFQSPHRARPASPSSSFIRLLYYWTDYVVGYWAVIRPQCVAGRSAIFDRYFYDFIVDPRRSRLALPRWLTSAFLSVTPKPDLIFFLDSDADTVFARKQELSREEIDRQLRSYRAIARQDHRRFVRLNASRTPDQVVAEAMKELVLRVYDKDPDHR